MSSLRRLSRLRDALRSVDVDEEKGTITAYGERFLFVPAKLIHSIENRLVENLGPVTAPSFQYEIGKEGGRIYVQLLKKSGFQIGDFEDMQRAADRFGTLAGWGKMELVESGPEKSLVRVRWTNGLSVRSRRGKTPVCHFTRGLMTGGAEEAFGRRCESLELKCEGKGDSFCEAVIGDPATIARIAESRKGQEV